MFTNYQNLAPYVYQQWMFGKGDVGMGMLLCMCTYVYEKEWGTTIVSLHTANEGPMRIQYKCLVPIYVFQEMKLYGLIISKTEL